MRILASSWYLFLSWTQYKRTVNDGNTKLCCSGFILALFQSATANKIDSERTRDYNKLFRVCKVELLHVTVMKLMVYHLFRLNF